MKILLTNYKDVFAAELRADKFTALVLPTEGGKIVSYKDCEGEEFLIQNPSPFYNHIGLFDSYVEGECSGFDEMFPTIDELEFISSEKKILYPDHGEVCRVPFNYEIINDALVMTFVSVMGYTYTKTLTEVSGKLFVTCEIKNFTNKDLDALWAGHCLIKAEIGGEILLPFL